MAVFFPVPGRCMPESQICMQHILPCKAPKITHTLISEKEKNAPHKQNNRQHHQRFSLYSFFPVCTIMQNDFKTKVKLTCNSISLCMSMCTNNKSTPLQMQFPIYANKCINFFYFVQPDSGTRVMFYFLHRAESKSCLCACTIVFIYKKI